MPRRVLISFAGLRDPDYAEPHEDGRCKGPILTVLDARHYDRVILLARPFREENAERTRRVLRELHPSLPVELLPVGIQDATNHPEILDELRRVLASIRRLGPEDDYTIALSSGTPEIHACWILITASGEFPARLVNFRRTTHNGFAGPRRLRELSWSSPLAAITPEMLTLLAGRRDRHDDSELQNPAAAVPRHYFARRSLEQAVLLSRHDAPVLVSGEPGTQKHYLAALIHHLGRNNTGPLLIFNCATLPESLFESVIFGDARDDAPGKIQQAEGGTLVLLKVQRVPAPVLLRLLKALNDGYFYAGKSRLPVKVHCRLIATTDRNLAEEARLGRFPAEALRSFQASEVRLPPLRERPGDISLLAQDELDRANRALPRPKRFSPGALAKLESHGWPSNVSELHRVVEQAVLNCEGATIQAADIDLDLTVNIANIFAGSAPRLRAGFSLIDYLRSVKEEIVRSALAKAAGNQSDAARLLGLTPQAISKYIRAFQPRSRRRKGARGGQAAGGSKM